LRLPRHTWLPPLLAAGLACLLRHHPAGIATLIAAALAKVRSAYRA